MMNQQTDSRIFRGGAWDLRRIDRRKEQVAIAFPDRRKTDRRMADKPEDFSAGGMLKWVDPSEMDE
jgi:hypothetical protein